MNKKMDGVGLKGDKHAVQLFYEMYANPVVNKFKY
jgi:hypothetical protein